MTYNPALKIFFIVCFLVLLLYVEREVKCCIGKYYVLNVPKKGK
jgi:hypothetical protein